MTVLKLVSLALFVQCAHRIRALGEQNFTEFKEMVYEHIEASTNYVFPIDNSALVDVTSEEVLDFGTYDFVIVGSGAGGSVLANRLSEIENWKVLLLEAGDADDDFVKILSFMGYVLNSDVTWGYRGAAQQNICLSSKNQVCHAGHGKVLGGTTAVNAGIYARGHPEDFDRWATVYGNVGWSFDEVLPYFKKSENVTFTPMDEEYHGRGGYLTVSQQSDTPLTQFVIDSLTDLGYEYGDHNGGRSNVVSRYQFAFEGNERVSASTAFLKPILNRTNLEIGLNSFVTKVTLDGGTAKRASGVEFVRNGTKYQANVTKDVIVSAGGYHSSQILLLSGIGPKEHLERFDIPVVADLPVGENFQDHLSCSAIRIATDRVLYNYTFLEKLQKYVEHERPLIYSGDAILMANLARNDTQRPDFEAKIRVVDPQPAGDYTPDNTDIALAVIMFHPKSRGTVTLISDSARDFPLIDANALNEGEDLEMLYQFHREMLALNDTETFRKNGLRVEALESPECTDEVYSKDWWYCIFKYRCVTDHHPVGSNSMGSDEKRSVVDARGKVHGIDGLRVADESVMPEAISGQNMAAVMMIGERISDFIKEDYKTVM